MPSHSEQPTLTPRRFPLWLCFLVAVLTAGLLFAAWWTDQIPFLRNWANPWMIGLHAAALGASLGAVAEWLRLSRRARIASRTQLEQVEQSEPWIRTPIEDCRSTLETRHNLADIERRVDQYATDALQRLADRWFPFYLLAIGILFAGALISVPQALRMPRQVFPVFEIIQSVVYATIDSTVLVLLTLLASRSGKSLVRAWSHLAKRWLGKTESAKTQLDASDANAPAGDGATPTAPVYVPPGPSDPNGPSDPPGMVGTYPAPPTNPPSNQGYAPTPNATAHNPPRELPPAPPPPHSQTFDDGEYVHVPEENDLTKDEGGWASDPVGYESPGEQAAEPNEEEYL